MNKPKCPVHTVSETATALNTGWPAGPKRRLLGWSLLSQLRRDFLGSFQLWQQQYGNVIHLDIWPEHEIILADPALVRELLVTHHQALIRWEHAIQVFSQFDGHSVLTTEGQTWKQKREALQPSFTQKNLQQFIPQIVAATEQALQSYTASAKPVETLLTALTMDIITRLLFSNSLTGEEMTKAPQAVHTLLMHANAEFYVPMKVPHWLPWKWEKRRALNYLRQWIDQHIQARLALDDANGSPDLLSQLLHLHRQDPIAWSLTSVADECMTLFLAGHETTAVTLRWWLWCMATHPQAQMQAREEIAQVLGQSAPTAETLGQLNYLQQTLKETMRLYPAAPTLLTRRSTQAIQLGNWQFPARTLFIVPLYLMQQDAKCFENPKHFMPERFDGKTTPPRGSYMPFGIGTRVCLGQHLATTEMVVIASMLLQRFNLTLTEPMSFDGMKAVFNVSLRPEKNLPIKLELLNS